MYVEQENTDVAKNLRQGSNDIRDIWCKVEAPCNACMQIENIYSDMYIQHS